MEGPGLLRIRDDLRGREEEAVGPGVPQLDAVHIGDAGHAEGPVQGGPSGHVEDTRNAPSLVELAVSIVQSVIASVCQITHFFESLNIFLEVEHTFLTLKPALPGALSSV